ncbi:MAG: squalene/phytoene synthase family protein [Planctomycetota bacterium]
MSNLESILTGVSRTFGLSIPYLPDQLRDEIGTAYLLCRIADTFEDEGTWDPITRVFLLRRFKRAVCSRGSRQPLLDVLNETVDHWGGGYNELLTNTLPILEHYDGFRVEAKQHIRSGLFFMIDGMGQFVMRNRTVDSLERLQRYCYAVAGVVGVMCTKLFVESNPQLATHRMRLIALSAKYGEGLQLINILRDESDDEDADRYLIPGSLSRESLIAQAAHDMAAADEYLTLLDINGADRGVIAFNELNIRLGHATLEAIERQGPGAKLDRQQVAEIAAAAG